MSERKKRRRFTDEFKRHAANLILVEGYSVKGAARAVGVDTKTMRAWRDKFAPETPPCGTDATEEEGQTEIQRLRHPPNESEPDPEK